MCGFKHVGVMQAFPFQLTSVLVNRSMVLQRLLFSLGLAHL